MICDSVVLLVLCDGDLICVCCGCFIGSGVDCQVWCEVCVMGWLVLCLDEVLGGSGLGMSEYVVLLEVLGCGLLFELLIEVGLVVLLLLEDECVVLLVVEWLVLLVGIVYCDGWWCFCMQEGWLYGEVVYVYLVGVVDVWLVVCEQGLVLVECDVDGVELFCEVIQDGVYLVCLCFCDVLVWWLFGEVVEQVLDEVVLVCVVYLVGLMDGVFE